MAVEAVPQPTCALPEGSASAGDAAPGPDSLVGRNVARKFVLETPLGVGGMGAVYRARHTALEKVVAIKVMHGGMARDPMFLARFHREARAASRLDHPNSIRVLDYGQDDDGLLYIAMEYLDGRDLSRILLEEWPLSNERIIDLLSQALAALAVAHDLGITHRDLKPENIMVVRGKTDDGADVEVVKVCDFGIAKLMEPGDDGAEPVSHGRVTTAGLVIGTPEYMSPEQGRGEVVDGRSDLYSMGVLLYQLLTGRLPFDAASAIEIVIKHQTTAPAAPSSLRGGIDARLEAICLRALEKAPEGRYQSARDFRTALRSALETVSLPPSACVVPVGQDAARRSSGPSFAHATTRGLVAARGSSDVVATKPGNVEPADARGRRVWPMALGTLLVAALAGRAGWHHDRPRLDRATTMEVTPRPTPTRARTEPAAPPSGDPVVTREPPDVAVHDGATMEPTAARSTPPDHEPVRKRTDESARVPVSGPRIVQWSLVAEPRGLATTPRAPEELPQPAAPPAPPPPPLLPAARTPVVATPVRAMAPSAPAPARFDLAKATVDVRGAVHVERTGAAGVDAAISHVKAAITDCYRRALPTLGGPLDGTGSLHVETDDEGWITRARVTSPVRGPVPSCIEATVHGSHVWGVDTGTASADIPLVFKPR
jgi:serine/threonine-protein kinase